MKVVSPSGANYGGTIFSESHGAGSDMTALYGVDFVTGYDYVDFLIYREDNARIPQLKIVDSIRRLLAMTMIPKILTFRNRLCLWEMH